MSLPIGSNLITFELPGTDGNTHGPADYADKKALVVVFSCNHCPNVLAWEDRLIQAQHDYAEAGAQFLLICANDPVKYPTDNFEAMIQHADHKGFPFPYLQDESQAIAHAYGATRTPEIFIFDEARILQYHGTVDDNYEDADLAQNHYLRAALESVLAGETPFITTTDPVGCTIKWK